jgi:hypothetical protein
MQEQAERLAEFGRNGDIYVVHAAEGETVVPTEVLDANPQVREMLFAQMRDMGLNPDEYVVGSELNSINPDTGMPEFFFKKLFRGVKKIIKKAAPLIVPLLGNMILPGIGGILASAIYTKATGGSWGDVLKGAAMSWLGGAVMGGFTGPGTFAEGFTQGLTAPFDALSDLSGSWNAGVLGSKGYTSMYPMPPSGAAASAPGAAASAPGAAGSAATGAADAGGTYRWTGGDPGFDFDKVSPLSGEIMIGGDGKGMVDFDFEAHINPPDDRNWFNKYVYDPGEGEGLAERYLSPNRASIQPDPTAVGEDVAAKVAAYEASGRKIPAGLERDFAKASQASAAPSMFTEYGPLALAGGVAAYAGGALDEPEREDWMSEDEWKKKVAEWQKNKLFAENPEDYVIPPEALDPYRYRPAPNQYVNRGGLMERQPRYMTNGGAAQYPRREMLVEGPGTERSDDIPAMLSDGEFVLNSRSVRGADPTGQGDRRRGAQNLYNMMRNFEMRA